MCNRRAGGPDLEKGCREAGRVRIKLCGLRRDCDIDWANELLPDYVGFVFAEGSRRYVEPRQAAHLSARLQAAIVPVGVFVDADQKEIVTLLEQKIIRGVQLHGHEDDAYVEELRKEMAEECLILQVFQIRGQADVEQACASRADCILLDSGGGSGEAFDWSLLDGVERPFFLAGGLTPENVGAAVSCCHPFGVDASSSLETGGYKDREKMAAFVRAGRGGPAGRQARAFGKT